MFSAVETFLASLSATTACRPTNPRVARTSDFYIAFTSLRHLSTRGTGKLR